MTTPVPRPGILKISPYVQGKSTVEGAPNPIKLSSNESSHGPSPRAIDAYAAAARHLHRYPDGGQTELREALGRAYRLDPAWIVCGNGSEELIGLLMRSYVGEGDEVVLSENGFVMCHIYVLGQGALPIFTPEKDDRIDVDAILARVTTRTRMVCIANPNNPTGTYISASEVLRLHAGLPENVVLLLDGAYAEYVNADDYHAGQDLVRNHANVAMLRTFSKIYGLAALRVGWVYAQPSLLDALQRLRTPFNVNSPAMAAAAAAVQDQAHVDYVREHNGRWVVQIRQILSTLGIEVIPSVTNFYLLRFPGDRGGGKSSIEAARFLEASGIIPRPMGVGGLLRITVGLDHENEAVIAALRGFMEI